jgi:predicted nucleotidyltransferase
MNTLVKLIFGSHLYGTNTSSSDTDYKGIYLPTLQECVPNKIDNVKIFNTKTYGGKNTNSNIDEEYYSLQYFMKLAIQGEMIVIDMLHAPKNMTLCSSQTWNELRNNRSKFYSKNLVGYLGYIRKQTATYSNKGNRLKAIDEILQVLHSQQGICDLKLKSVWNLLPINEYCNELINPKETRWEFYQVCGKQLSEHITVNEAIKILSTLRLSYGTRANQAGKNGGVDWKAVSHAFRAGLQLKEIYTTGDLIYPLKDYEFIRNVKTGVFDYDKDSIGEKLEDLLCDIEQLSNNSSYPDNVDKSWMEDFIVRQYK